MLVNSKQATTKQRRLQSSNIDTRNYIGTIDEQTTPKDWRKWKENKEEHDLYDSYGRRWTDQDVIVEVLLELMRANVEGGWGENDKQLTFMIGVLRE